MSDTGVCSRECRCLIGVYTVGRIGVWGIDSRECRCLIGVCTVGRVGM